MLRLLRWRPNVISLGSRINRAAIPEAKIPPRPQTLRVQNVRIRRWFRPRNFIIGGCIYYFCYQAYDRVVFGTLDRAAEKMVSQMSPRERSAREEEAEEPIFIPIPFTARRVDPVPYRGTDPEWQTFIKLSKDTQKLASIRTDLAEYVRRSALADRVYGKDIQPGSLWLDIEFPYKAPATFVRKGLLISDDGIEIGEKPIDSLHYFRESRIFWPREVAVSVYTLLNALVMQEADFLARSARRLTPEPKVETNAVLQQTVEKINKQMKKSSGKTEAPPSTTLSKTQSTSSSETGPSTSKVKGPPGTTTEPATMSSSTGERNADALAAQLIQYHRKATEHFQGPREAFHKRLAREWRRTRSYPPRGCVMVSGLVSLKTPKARVTVDVVAWWDPKTEAFHQPSMSLSLRAIRMWRQSPIG
ncbi:hypothetical protein F4780DRAFT_353841 [Xylariomycetidae sp. FL0641]|nr:hypothetical protein F4780DRAFT_353841 [Xylariomycetidae sp. FL0641]